MTYKETETQRIDVTYQVQISFSLCDNEYAKP